MKICEVFGAVDPVLSLRYGAVTEAHASQTDGIWITSTGEIIATDHQKRIHHIDLTLRHFPPSDDLHDTSTSLDRALKAGWIRITWRGTSELSVSWKADAMSNMAKRTFRLWWKEHSAAFATFQIASPYLHRDFSDERTALSFIGKVWRKNSA